MLLLAQDFCGFIGLMLGLFWASESVSSKRVLQECRVRMYYKRVKSECPSKVSSKSVLQECRVRASYKIVK